MAKDAKWYAGWVRLANAQSAEEKLTNLETADFIENLAAELEREKDHSKHGYDSAALIANEYKKLEAELEEVKQDRDAAMNDIAHICHTCNKKRCIGCKQCSNWVWRGLCTENERK